MSVTGWTLHHVTRRLAEDELSELERVLCAGDVVILLGEGHESLAMIGAERAQATDCEWFIWGARDRDDDAQPWLRDLTASHWADLVASCGRALTWGS